MSDRVFHTADLYCGGGGFTAGLELAMKDRGIEPGERWRHVAVNHWDVAIATHSANFPHAEHFCEPMETVDPRKAVPGGKLDLLVASPECTHHSNARGGKPMSDQSRATAWHILRWCEALYVEQVIIENVREFMKWGALNEHGRPIKAREGELFRRFLSTLRAMDYSVEFRVLNSAYYGGATTRERLFIQARRRRKPITWPEATHAKPGFDKLGLFPDARPWRAAREIIDWSLDGRSIYGRKKPLSPNTLRRIYAGLRKFSGLPFITASGGPEWQGRNPQSVDDPVGTILAQDHRALAQPFLVILRNNEDASPISEPLRTLTAGGNHVGVAEPFLVSAAHGVKMGDSNDRRAHSLGEPLGSVLGSNNFALVEPFVLGQQSCSSPRSTDAPIPTVAGAGAIGLVEAMVLPVTHAGGEERVQSAADPLPTVTGAHRGELPLAEPMIVTTAYGPTARGCVRNSATDPVPTITTRAGIGVAELFLVVNRTHSDAESLDDPVPTLTTGGNMAVAEPVVVPQFGESQAKPVNEPLGAITTTSRGIGLAEPVLIPYFSERDGQEPRADSIADPLNTVTCQNRIGIANPCLVKYYGAEDDAQSVDDPLDTVTSRDRFALVSPELVATGAIDRDRIVGYLDIRFRMLQPHELAAAMGFSDAYHFTGNREAQVKQIGNAVSVEVAHALCAEALRRS